MRDPRSGSADLSSRRSAGRARRSRPRREPPAAADLPFQPTHYASGGFDNRHRGDDVVGLQPGVDHDIDMAHRQLGVGVAVAAVAHQAGASLTASNNARSSASVNIVGVVQYTTASSRPTPCRVRSG